MIDYGPDTVRDFNEKDRISVNFNIRTFYMKTRVESRNEISTRIDRTGVKTGKGGIVTRG